MSVLAYSKWDVVPVLCGFAHLAFLATFFAVFPFAPWWVLVAMGLTYSVSISWNINGISHNFLHNPYFKSHLMNRIFSLVESLSMGFSQTFYEYVHQRHHMGNSDRPDEQGETIDWLSIYRHGHEGEAENIWSYVFLSYFRDDPKVIYREIARRNPGMPSGAYLKSLHSSPLSPSVFFLIGTSWCSSCPFTISGTAFPTSTAIIFTSVGIRTSPSPGA